VLGKSYEQQLKQLHTVKAEVTEAIAAQRRLQVPEGTLAQELAKLDSQARDAMASAQAPLARAAEEHRDLLQAQARSLDEQIGELEGATEQLTKAEVKLRCWAKRFRPDTNSLDTSSRGDAHAYLSEATAEVGDTLADVVLVMQRAIQNTEDINARAPTLT
jgi:phage shock protein A